MVIVTLTLTLLRMIFSIYDSIYILIFDEDAFLKSTKNEKENISVIFS